MTTVAAPTAGGSSLRWALSDAWVLTWRNLTIWRRVPAYLVFTVVQPMIFTLLFRYVFGGAIPTPGIPGGYVDFLIPGVIGQTAAFATMATAFVPVRSMPGWLQAFAVNQPITHVINALRSLALGTPMRDNLWLSVVWLVVIVAVFMPLCVRAYKRVS